MKAVHEKIEVSMETEVPNGNSTQSNSQNEEMGAD